MTIDTCFENFSGADLKATAAFTPKCHPHDDPCLRYRLSFRTRYAWRKAAEAMAGHQRTQIWKISLTIRGRLPAGSTGGGTTSGARRSNPSTPKTNRCGGKPNGWWEFLLLLPLVTTVGIALSDSDKSKPLPKSRDSVSTGDRYFGPGSYWDGWRGVESLLHDPC